MKKLILVSIIATLGLFACKKDFNPHKSATITGQDYRKCMCCSGWFVEVGDSTFRFFEVPATSDLDLSKETFPLNVFLEYTKDEDGCMPDLILVNSISKM